MAKEIKLLIGGSERTLKFGTNGFFKHAGEVYDGDPMELLYGINTVELLKFAGKTDEEARTAITGISNPKKLFNIIYAFVYAGLACAGGTDTKEEVQTWVEDLDFLDGDRILKEGRSALTDKDQKPGETEAQTIVNQESE